MEQSNAVLAMSSTSRYQSLLGKAVRKLKPSWRWMLNASPAPTLVDPRPIVSTGEVVQ